MKKQGATARRKPAPKGEQRSRSAQQADDGGAAWITGFTFVYLLALAGAIAVQALPRWAVAVLLLLNVLTFSAYWLDKRAAQRGNRRIPERTLHLWSLAGGWPAAWASQRVLRHKSSKVSFLRGYWLTVVVHCAAAAGGVWWRLGAH